MDQQQRARLLGHKLRAIAGVSVQTAPVAGGAGLLDGDRAWVLVDEDPERGLGATLAWAVRRGAASAVTVVDDGAVAGLLARRATALSFPIEVRHVEGSASLVAAPADPPPAGPYTPSSAVEPHLPAAAAAGVEVVAHADGSVSFEVLGLEVGRVTADGKLSAGVGRHDRDAYDDLYQGEPDAAALLKVADVVRERRRADAQPGPANLLQRERWIRASLDVEPLPEPRFPTDLRRPRPAAGLAEGGDVLVVCSAGVDLDLIPAAADAWIAAGRRPSRARLVVPTGDDKSITHDLAELLRIPAEVQPIDPPWVS